MTAALRISPIEYATLKRVYEGEAYSVAVELDVTIQVLVDFQNLTLPTLIDL